MVARIKRPKSKAKLNYYTTGPVAPKDKTTSKIPVQSSSLGNDVPKMVPTAPARTGALGKRHAVPTPSGGSKIRVSGNPAAHHIGKR